MSAYLLSVITRLRAEAHGAAGVGGGLVVRIQD